MKLDQIQKKDHKQEGENSTSVEPIVEDRQLDEATGGDDNIEVYGLDRSDPRYHEKVEDLKRLKKRDPALFRKMQSMD